MIPAHLFQFEKSRQEVNVRTQENLLPGTVVQLVAQHIVELGQETGSLVRVFLHENIGIVEHIEQEMGIDLVLQLLQFRLHRSFFQFRDLPVIDHPAPEQFDTGGSHGNHPDDHDCVKNIG